MGMLLTRHYATNNANKANGAAPKESAPAPTRVEKKPEPEYTPEKINAMNGAQLRKVAEKYGIENPEEFTVKELKATLCEKFS